MPPNILQLDKVFNDRHSEAKRRKKNDSTPTINIHMPPMHDILNTPRKHRSSKSRAEESDAGPNSSDSDDGIPIGDVLKTLDKRYPANSFPQYESRLQAEGIWYLQGTHDCDREFYTQTIGMSKGAVGLFMKEVKRARKRHTVARHAAQAVVPDDDHFFD